MRYTVNVLALVAFASTLVEGHGKLALATGDAGGNTTALGIMGGVVPGAGPNGKTEIDTTVFKSRNVASKGLGKTTKGGNNKVAAVASAMALSGNTLPQVSSTGGSFSGVFHVVTTDGAGPLVAALDTTGTGDFTNSPKLTFTENVPGKGGNFIGTQGKAIGGGKRSVLEILRRAVFGKRATNVNESFKFKVEVPAGTKCEGKDPKVQGNFCLMKIANTNAAGPFGGVALFQMAEGGAAPAQPGGAEPAAGSPSLQPAPGSEPAAGGKPATGGGEPAAGGKKGGENAAGGKKGGENAAGGNNGGENAAGGKKGGAGGKTGGGNAGEGNAKGASRQGQAGTKNNAQQKRAVQFSA
ncbi:hypothetical protein QQS21_000507 [Conoideocrella luteorostrata]|uniref:Uncharacterized protein n=1 Tax=Conoideocrella luteorostrata TaxID=1105319 RepID=A0AAJ0CZK3_9HYPO|nr:hypothetical protein QQS21_000507 [Conoideocrella luteorostrata]